MEIQSGYATRKPFLFIILIYLIAGLTWLYLGGILIGIIDKSHPDTDLRYLYAFKNVSFMFFTAVALFFLLRAYQKRLLRAESNYFKLFEASPGAIYVMEKLSFRFLAVNDVMVSKYGYSRTQLLKMTAMDIRPKHEQTKLRNYMNSDHAEGHETGIWLHQKRNGDAFYVLISHHSIKFKDSDAYIVIAIDIDRDIRNEQRLKEIAWTNSHEIRKPISNILGLIEIMKTESPNQPTDPELLKMLVSSAYELDGIVKKINSHAAELDRI
ncbi:PAS domain S-box protein [Pedobacter nyackensis]|uniref:PAS domain S-box protein n=1 Tax=Pedobacter nyackensis TaxID=475255 RepID=UPI00292E80AF|nr:PAS domain S-box protein [Pedobacter nyackensis]